MSRGDYDDRFDDRDRDRDGDSGGGARQRALAKVKGPAIGLMVAAILGFLTIPIGMGYEFSGMAEQQRQSDLRNLEADPNMPAQQKKDAIEITKKIQEVTKPVMYVLWAVIALLSVVTLVGAVKMKNLSGRGWAYAASVLSMLPCTSGCCLLGLPFGIWAVVVLADPEVKRAFADPAGSRDDFDDRGR